MSNKASDLVNYALSQVGYCEDPLGSNHNKYASYIDTTEWYLRKEGSKIWIHKVDYHDWCSTFADCCAVKTFGLTQARKVLNRPVYNNYGSTVKYSYNYLKSIGKTGKVPQYGAYIYFQNSAGLCHVGIVVSFNSDTVTTVEGNAGTGSNYVVKKTYKRSDNYIYGYGYPLYDDIKPEPTEDYKPGSIYNVTCKGPLRIRKGAGTSYDIIDDLYKGDKVLCKEVIKDKDGNTWLKIEGYTCAKYGKEVYIE